MWRRYGATPLHLFLKATPCFHFDITTLTAQISIILIFVVATLYAVVGVAAMFIARRTRALPPSDDETDLPTVSVLVAARNEERHLPDCLRALREQDYPAERIEFLIADDHSTDRTPSVIREAAREDERFRWVAVPDAPDGLPRGKPNALHAAYGRASGEVLLVTDADCAPPPGWARHMAAQFRDERLGVACGVTWVKAGGSALGRIQTLDWLLLLTVASAAASVGFPITAMGNNMAFRCEAYDAVGGYPALPFSVTEDFALFQAVHRAGWNVRLVLAETLRNATRPLRSLRAVVRQRRRWARGGLAAPWWVYGLYALVFGTHGLLVAGLVAAPLAALGGLAAKCGVDALLLGIGGARLGKRPPLRLLPAFEAYLFGYVLLMPAALAVFPRIRWKGRRF